MTDTNTLIKNANGNTDVFKVFISISATLMLGLISWSLSTSIKTQVTLAENNVILTRLVDDYKELETDLNRIEDTRYTSAQADAEWRLQKTVDRSQEDKIERALEWARRLSDRVANMEQKRKDQDG